MSGTNEKINYSDYPLTPIILNRNQLTPIKEKPRDHMTLYLNAIKVLVNKRRDLKRKAQKYEDLKSVSRNLFN